MESGGAIRMESDDRMESGGAIRIESDGTIRWRVLVL